MSRARSRRPPCQGEGIPPWVVPISIPTPYPVGPVTVYLLEGEPLTLVDTGPATREAWRALVSGLDAHRVSPADVRRLLITHAHHDHIGLASRLAALGAEVWVHPDDEHHVRVRRHHRRSWRRLQAAGLPLRRRLAVVLGLALLDRTTRPLAHFQPLADGQVLPHERSPIRVHHTPGHSPGHVAFELVGEGILISGDTLLDGITPNAVVEADPHDPDRMFLSLAAYNATLERIAALRPRLLLPAHGPCLADVEGQIAIVRERQSERARLILELLAHAPATVGDLLVRMFPRVGPVGTFLACSEVLGHLLELERRGEAVRSPVRGRDLWRPAR